MSVIRRHLVVGNQRFLELGAASRQREQCLADARPPGIVDLPDSASSRQETFSLADPLRSENVLRLKSINLRRTWEYCCKSKRGNILISGEPSQRITIVTSDYGSKHQI